jgi:DNA-binding NarL/FixJ family response regulator
MAHQERPRVLLADDYPALLVAWRRLLTPTCDVVGDVSDGQAVFETAIRLVPDIIVLDLSMLGSDGFDACRAITRAIPATRVVLVTAAADPGLAQAALRAGASAFVRKEAAADDLPEAIGRVLAGETYCSAFPHRDVR